LDKNTKQRHVDWCNLTLKDNLYYLNDENEPFTGNYYVYFDNGQLGEKGEIKNGSNNGRFTIWDEKGVKLLEGGYKGGKKHGKVMLFYKTG